jgi:hypothetical protein
MTCGAQSWTGAQTTAVLLLATTWPLLLLLLLWNCLKCLPDLTLAWLCGLRCRHCWGEPESPLVVRAVYCRCPGGVWGQLRLQGQAVAWWCCWGAWG